jgi:flagellin-like protein
MTLRERINALKADEGVSPVIAVILMVAITVVLAATVYVWVSGFASEQEGPEQASATATGVDLDDDGDVEWAKITLTSGENAPYDFEDTSISTTDVNGTSVNEVCTTAEWSWSASPPECGGQTWASDQSWGSGENLWVACQGDGSHLITVSVRGSTILDSSVSCDTGV